MSVDRESIFLLLFYCMSSYLFNIYIYIYCLNYVEMIIAGMGMNKCAKQMGEKLLYIYIS